MTQITRERILDAYAKLDAAYERRWGSLNKAVTVATRQGFRIACGKAFGKDLTDNGASVTRACLENQIRIPRTKEDIEMFMNEWRRGIDWKCAKSSKICDIAYRNNVSSLKKEKTWLSPTKYIEFHTESEDFLATESDKKLMRSEKQTIIDDFKAVATWQDDLILWRQVDLPKELEGSIYGWHWLRSDMTVLDFVSNQYKYAYISASFWKPWIDEFGCSEVTYYHDKDGRIELKLFLSNDSYEDSIASEEDDYCVFVLKHKMPACG